MQFDFRFFWHMIIEVTSEYPIYKLFSMIKAECFVWTSVVQLFSFIRIDMVYHMINAGPFRKNPTYIVHDMGYRQQSLVNLNTYL